MFTHDYLLEGAAVMSKIKQRVSEKEEDSRAEAARVFEHSNSADEQSVSSSSHF